MRISLPSAFLAVLFAVPAAAAWQSIPSTDFTVDPPPAAGSAADRQDMATLVSDQQTRTAQQCSQAASMSSPDFHSLWDSSGLLSPAELAAVGPFVDSVSQYISKVSTFFKKKYARPRPYNENPDLQPCADKPGGNTAYPSTHAASGAVDACVLDQLFPSRKAELDAYGKLVGDLRVISGVHHPTDVAAGQALGAQVCQTLLSDDSFQAQLSSVRAALPAR
jgi:hypothetical protein